MSDKVVLLDTHFSYFGMRVRLTLAEKGIEYEYSEENLDEKSSLLLEMNPINKQIPVLIHNGKPICESLIIVDYIDEVWKDNSPILPLEPYQKAQAKFWADVFDKKVAVAANKVWISKSVEEKEVAKKEFIEALKLFEAKLGDEPYFGGKEFGYLDLVIIPFSSWFGAYETCGNFVIEKYCPKIVAWAARCMERETVSKSLADREKVNEFVPLLRKRIGID